MVGSSPYSARINPSAFNKQLDQRLDTAEIKMKELSSEKKENNNDTAVNNLRRSIHKDDGISVKNMKKPTNLNSKVLKEENPGKIEGLKVDDKKIKTA